MTPTAYRWLCGGVPVNDHPLADFRSHPGDALDDLLTDHVASLMAACRQAQGGGAGRDARTSE